MWQKPNLIQNLGTCADHFKAKLCQHHKHKCIPYVTQNVLWVYLKDQKVNVAEKKTSFVLRIINEVCSQNSEFLELRLEVIIVNSRF